MSILFSGDFHAGVCNELHGITKRSLLKNYGKTLFNNIRYHIILGDGGFLWPGNFPTNIFNFRVLGNRPFPVLCVLGNHEPIYGMLDKIPLEDIGIGETLYQINNMPQVAYLQRGKVYTIDGFKILVLGGALSIDKKRRTPGQTWWENEYWSEQERRNVLKLLKTDTTFDCVISHTGPHHINQTLFNSDNFDYQKFIDKVALLNDVIHEQIQFGQWLCGHWHSDRCHHDGKSGKTYQYLYRTTLILEKKGGRITVYNEKSRTQPSTLYQK
jgi:3-oxoacid CoA-transferase subunit A